MSLPKGIYWDRGQTPPRHFAIVFLRAAANANAEDVASVLTGLSRLWSGLEQGRIPDLPGAEIPPSDFSWLVGYGRKAFEIPHVARNMPKRLQRNNVFNSTLPGGGGHVLDGAGIRYADDLPLNPATEEIMVQFTGATPLAVNRGIAETWKRLNQLKNPLDQRAPLMIASSFTGFNREDHRSWIGFHDGISNLEPGGERRSVIEIRTNASEENDAWTQGGTYLAFMRLSVDLPVWERISAQEQEILVGRTKISGCPLSAVDGAGNPVPESGCPVPGNPDITAPENVRFREPGSAVSAEIKTSHVQRANQHQQDPSRRSSNRFYRQGYEYLEPPIPGRPFQLGLNFVSFQEHPERLLNTLKLNTWLGQTNFGGTPGPEVIHAYAAGLYICPPIVAGEAFPGESIFKQVPTATAATSGDDLKKIKGIGPKLEAALHAQGVFRFAQISRWTNDDIERFESTAVSFKDRVTRDDWIRQANDLADGSGESQ